MPTSDESEMQVRFSGAATDGNSVPVDILTTSLGSLQKLVHLLAAGLTGFDEMGGATVPAAFKRRYALVCRLPESGSYTVPVAISETADALGADIAHRLHRLLGAVRSRAGAELEQMFPQPQILAGVQRTLCSLVPKPHSGVRMAVQTRSGRDIFVPDAETVRFLRRLTASRAPTDIGRSLMGHLKEIDFDQHRFRFQHPPTGRELGCAYPHELEEVLVERRRDLIQVIGEIPIGADDVPKRVRSVEAIHRVDKSPIELTEFIAGGRRVWARRPIAFEPAIDDAYQHYLLRDAPFGIHLMFLTREDLETNLHEEMDVIWRHYACAKDAMLTPAARELKQQLHGAFHAE